MNTDFSFNHGKNSVIISSFPGQESFTTSSQGNTKSMNVYTESSQQDPNSGYSQKQKGQIRPKTHHSWHSSVKNNNNKKC